MMKLLINALIVGAASKQKPKVNFNKPNFHSSIQSSRLRKTLAQKPIMLLFKERNFIE
jgi:hypothetical protein